jgi:presenilin-like A22 family membrane protease
MSSLFLALARENPWPGIAVASLNLIVGVSLLLGLTVSVLAWVFALADREPEPVRQAASRRGFA